MALKRAPVRLLRCWTGLVLIIASQPACHSAPPPKAREQAQPASSRDQGTGRSAGPQAPAAPESFTAWLAANPGDAPRVAALGAFLAREGVGDVLPVWQLVRNETDEAVTRCGIDRYVVPPEADWPMIVPTLKLVRDAIVPAVGPVRVLSSYRTPAANRCAAGAAKSTHQSFRALDLQTVNPVPQKELFATLCKVWAATPWDVGFGLGAYYTRTMPGANQEGRFHVDTLGRRTWGFGYRAYHSHCRELGYISVKSPQQEEAEEKAKLEAEVKAQKDATDALAADAKAKSEAEAKAKAEVKAKRDAEAAASAKAEADLAAFAVVKDGSAGP